jgi:hypothetical protein
VITELLVAAGAGVVYVTPALAVTRRTYARLFTVSHKCGNGSGSVRCGAPAYGRVRYWCQHGHDFKQWTCPEHMRRMRRAGYWAECGDCRVKNNRKGVRLSPQVLDGDGMSPGEAKHAALVRGFFWPVFLGRRAVSGVLFGHQVQPKLPYLTDTEVAALERANLPRLGDEEGKP